MQEARKRMREEIDIVKIIKTQRYFEAALKLLLKENKRLKLKAHSRYF
jgi:hypothetical protein